MDICCSTCDSTAGPRLPSQPRDVPDDLLSAELWTDVAQQVTELVETHRGRSTRREFIQSLLTGHTLFHARHHGLHVRLRKLQSTQTQTWTVYSQTRVVFKIAGLVHQSLVVGAAPAYLADDCRLLSDVGRRPLSSNSNDIRKLLVPRTHNKLGDRSFSAAGPRLWNDLPPGLRRPGLIFDSFRQSLKSHLFQDRSA